METNDPLPAGKPASRWRRFKAPAGGLFWAWIGYQAVKGTLTTAFIWVPMLYLWFSNHPIGG